MAITVNTEIIVGLEKELKDYAQKLINGTSELADAFSKVMKTETHTHNVPSIVNKYIMKAKDDLILQGADKRMATRIAKEVITKQTGQILARIN